MSYEIQFQISSKPEIGA